MNDLKIPFKSRCYFGISRIISIGTFPEGITENDVYKNKPDFIMEAMILTEIIDLKN